MKSYWIAIFLIFLHFAGFSQSIADMRQKRETEEKTHQNGEIQKLPKKELELIERLKDQKKTEQQLENNIHQLFAEVEVNNIEEGGSGFALTPDRRLVGDSFVQNKKKLPWPVERGIITEHFGMHQHPVLPNVITRNNGINIATEDSAKVRAVFNGEVSRVFGISGGNMAVIIRHGIYLSVYSNLKEVVVKTGEKVATKQVIGTVYTGTGENYKSVLKFQIWHENEKQDPEEWISR